MTLREHVQAIYEQHGQLTPELVVKAARPKNHPLHHRIFDRPPGEAANAWYLHRANELIKEVRIEYGNEDDAKSIRAYYSVKTKDGPVYEPTEKIGQDPFLRRMLISEMEREVASLEARFGELVEFWGRLEDGLSKAA